MTCSHDASGNPANTTDPAIRPSGCRPRHRNWAVERISGTTSELLDATYGSRSTQRQLRLLKVQDTALVLGSTQKLSAVDAASVARAGVRVVRRRSGGGAVLLAPLRQLWADFVVPASDPLWSDDVAHAVAWVGELWSQVIRRLGDARAEIYEGKLVADRWGKLVCFAGTGPGEVFVNDRKLVGVSQRRNRHRAQIQTMLRLSPDTHNTHDAQVGLEQVNHRTADLADSAGGALMLEPDFLALTQTERMQARAALVERSGSLRTQYHTAEQALLAALSNGDF